MLGQCISMVLPEVRLPVAHTFNMYENPVSDNDINPVSDNDTMYVGTLNPICVYIWHEGGDTLYY